MRRHSLPRPNLGPSHDRWLVSYADFITLLFAFFTAMYASSTVDAQKLAAMVDSINRVFGGTAAHGTAGIVGPGDEILAAERAGKGLLEVQQALRRDLADEIADGRVSLAWDARGLVVSIHETGSFKTGSAELPPAAEALLRRLGEQLRKIDNPVRVEGHTDDVPIRTARYDSNWELSTARATRVVAFLIASASIPPERLSAAGYSEFRPRVPNDSPANRARNRRVDLVVLNHQTSVAEEPGAAGQP